MVLSLLMACVFSQSGALSWAGEERPRAYSLSDVLTFAAQHNPVLAGAWATGAGSSGRAERARRDP